MATKTLHVWAHWTAAAPAPTNAPTALPPSLTSYGAPPTAFVTAKSPTAFVQKWSVGPTLTVWAEVARQTDIATAAWSGAAWPGFPPPSGDEGYDPAAFNFRVTAVTLRLPGVSNTGFDFVVKDPTGAVVGTVTPATPALSPGIYPLTGAAGGPISPVTDGRGLWTIEIAPHPGSSVGEPALLLGGPSGNSVLEPYVSPYGSPLEGILGLDLTGDELFCPDADQTTVTATDLGCQPDYRRRYQIDVTFSPPLPPQSKVFWSFGDGQTDGPVNASGALVSTTHDYLPSPGQPYDMYVLPGPAGLLQCAPIHASIDVLPCIGCPALLFDVPPNGQLPEPLVTGNAGAGALVVCKVKCDWGTLPNPPVPTHYTWVIRHSAWPAGKQAERTTGGGLTSTVDSSSGWSDGPASTGATTSAGAVDLSLPGSYDVSVAAKFSSSPLPPTCVLQTNAQFTLPPSGPTIPQPCPRIDAMNVQGPGCVDPAAGTTTTVTVTASIGNPGSVAGPYTWDFGDPASGPLNTTTTAQPQAQHTYAQPGTYLVQLSVPAPPQCSPNPIVGVTSLTVPLCDCPQGQHRDANGACVPDTPPPPPPPPPAKSDPGCGIVRTIIALLLAGFLVTLVGALCLGWSAYVAAGLLAAALLLVVLWIILCRPSFCDVLVLLWQTCFTAGMVLLWLSGCFAATPCPGTAYAWIPAVVLAAGFFVWWVIRCRPSRCSILWKLLGAVVDTGALIAMLGMAMKYLSILGALCTAMLAGVPWGLAIAGAALVSVIAALQCAPEP